MTRTFALLIDGSGSMAGRNMQSALEAGLIVAQAAGSVGASLHDGGFQFVRLCPCGFPRL